MKQAFNNKKPNKINGKIKINLTQKINKTHQNYWPITIKYLKNQESRRPFAVIEGKFSAQTQLIIVALTKRLALIYCRGFSNMTKRRSFLRQNIGYTVEEWIRWRKKCHETFEKIKLRRKFVILFYIQLNLSCQIPILFCYFFN